MKISILHPLLLGWFILLSILFLKIECCLISKKSIGNFEPKYAQVCSKYDDFSKLKASILVKMFMDIYIMEMKKTFDQPEVCFMANIAQPQSENLDFG